MNTLKFNRILEINAPNRFGIDLDLKFNVLAICWKTNKVTFYRTGCFGYPFIFLGVIDD